MLVRELGAQIFITFSTVESLAGVAVARASHPVCTSGVPDSAVEGAKL